MSLNSVFGYSFPLNEKSSVIFFTHLLFPTIKPQIKAGEFDFLHSKQKLISYNKSTEHKAVYFSFKGLVSHVKL